MLKTIKFALKVIFYTFHAPKPKIKEIEYKIERKSFRINYGKYYTKTEKFTLLIWLFALLILTSESLYMTLFLYRDFTRFLFFGALIIFYIAYMKNVSRLKGKYRKRAIEEGSFYG